MVKECIIKLHYDVGETETLKLEKWKGGQPYRYAEWLITKMVNDSPYFTWWFANDIDILSHIGERFLCAKSIDIEPINVADNE